MKELRISAVMPVSDDAFGQLDKMAAIKPHIDALAREMGVAVEARIVTAKVPAAKKAMEAVDVAAKPEPKPEPIIGHQTTGKKAA